MMNHIDSSNINQTIERFMAGETSIEEEKALYAFFARPGLPKELEAYRPMFGWYASLGTVTDGNFGEVHVEASEEAHTDTRLPKHSKKALILPLRPLHWLGIAAMLALVFTLGFYYRTSSSIPEEYLSYEGSYIIRNGKKITDLRVVVPEILRTEGIVNERIDALNLSLEEAEDAFNRAVFESYDTSDPTVREVILAALDD